MFPIVLPFGLGVITADLAAKAGITTAVFASQVAVSAVIVESARANGANDEAQRISTHLRAQRVGSAKPLDLYPTPFHEAGDILGVGIQNAGFLYRQLFMSPVFLAHLAHRRNVKGDIVKYNAKKTKAQYEMVALQLQGLEKDALDRRRQIIDCDDRLAQLNRKLEEVTKTVVEFHVTMNERAKTAHQREVDGQLKVNHRLLNGYDTAEAMAVADSYEAQS